MTNSTFSRNLVRKGKRAILSARVALQIGDPDNAVNRSYYAMFDMARAALLDAGIPEDQLPRTHKGVIEAFRKHAIESGKIDVALASVLSRAEALRLQADYLDSEINAHFAADAVAQAEAFVSTVERVFALEGPSLGAEFEKDNKGHDDKISEPDLAIDRPNTRKFGVQPLSMEEERRQARENWLKLRQQRIEGGKGGALSNDADRGAKEDHGFSLDTDADD